MTLVIPVALISCTPNMPDFIVELCVILFPLEVGKIHAAISVWEEKGNSTMILFVKNSNIDVKSLRFLSQY